MKQWEIQKAIFSRLSSELSYSVFDHVPQDEQDFPYVVIGDDTGLQWDTGDSRGSESTLTIHVWSRQLGRRECKEIMDEIYQALHEYELDIDDMHTVICHWEFSESFLDPDGITRHGVTRFRIIAEEY